MFNYIYDVDGTICEGNALDQVFCNLGLRISLVHWRLRPLVTSVLVFIIVLTGKREWLRAEVVSVFFQESNSKRVYLKNALSSNSAFVSNCHLYKIIFGTCLLNKPLFVQTLFDYLLCRFDKSVVFAWLNSNSFLDEEAVFVGDKISDSYLGYDFVCAK